MKAMYIAGIQPTGFALPIVQLVQSFINFFAGDDAEDDEKGEDDKIVDDLDADDGSDLFGDDDSDDDKEEDEDDSKEKDKSKDKSAIVQKQKYRGLYKQTKTQLEEALRKLDEKDKKADPSDENAKKEKEARDYLRGLVEEVLGERESKDSRELAAFKEQVEELLEDNEDLTEKQILEVVEELGVTPKQAVAAIRRELKSADKGKKAKPAVPRSKRGADGTVDSDKDDKPKKPMTLEEASALAKKQLRSMKA